MWGCSVGGVIIPSRLLTFLWYAMLLVWVDQIRVRLKCVG